MTSHAMTLPGQNRVAEPNAADCRGRECFIVVRVEFEGDTTASWHATLQGGALAMDSYLTQYNAQFKDHHGNNCQFRCLPPSIHVACDGDYKALEAELERANQARFGTDR